MAWASFEEQSFQENPETPYEILVLPNKIHVSGLLGAEILVDAFASKEMRTGGSPVRVKL